MFFSEVDNGSCLLVIDGNTLSLRNIRQDGAMTDHVAIVKRGGPGDFDNDADVNLDDYQVFAGCLSESEALPPTGVPASAECLSGFGFEGDGDIDLLDFGNFQRVFHGTNP